jgi:hypothetical protein
VILRLMRKDLLLNRPVVAVVAAGIVLVVVLLSSGAGTQRGDAIPFEVVLFLASVYGSLLATLFAGRDDRYRTRAFNLGLPVTRREIVLARYLFSLLALPLWIGITVAVRWCWFWPVFPSEAFTPGSLALAFCGFVAGAGITFPLVVWAGFLGLVYGGVGLQVLALTTVVLIRLVPAARPTLGAIGGIVPTLGRLHAGIGDPWYLLAATAALLCLYGLSFAVAAALYQRKTA